MTSLTSEKVLGTKAQEDIQAEKKSISDGSQAQVENVPNQNVTHGIDTTALPSGADIVYERKVAIMNQALIDLGMGPFQWKIFAMTGFGWFVDNVRDQPMYQHSYFAAHLANCWREIVLDASYYYH